MESEPEIIPRTRVRRRKQNDTSKSNLDSMLKNVKTNEEKVVKENSWSFESKMISVFIIVLIIVLVLIILWFMYRPEEDIGPVSLQPGMPPGMQRRVPPGMGTNNVPPEYMAKWMQQQQQQQQQVARMQQAQQQQRNPQKPTGEESMKSILKKKMRKSKAAKKNANSELGPVPGEQLDNPQLYVKKSVKFKEDKKEDKKEGNQEENVQQNEVSANEEEERQNAMDAALIFDS